MTLQGIDIRSMEFGRFLNMLEVHILSGAEDDKERVKLKRKIYDPPKTVRARPARTGRGKKPAPRATALTASSVDAILAQLDSMGGG